ETAMQGDRVSTRRIAAYAAAAALLAALLPATAAAQAQLGSQHPTPRLTAVTPCGGKVGSTVEVTFAGTDLHQPKDLLFTHPGLKATAAPPPPVKIDPKAKKGPKQKDPPKPQVSKFTVTIDPAVPPGNYDVRLVGAHGVSNPRVFVVGELAEVLEKEPNN